MINTKDLYDILEQLETLIFDSKRAVFNPSCSQVDVDEARNLINSARSAIPDQIRMAQRVLDERETIIVGAKKEAESITKKAEERARMLVSNDEITRHARQQATDILSQAQAQAKKLRDSANDYINEILTEAETGLSASLNEVKRTKTAFQSKIRR